MKKKLIFLLLSSFLISLNTCKQKDKDSNIKIENNILDGKDFRDLKYETDSIIFGTRMMKYIMSGGIIKDMFGKTLMVEMNEYNINGFLSKTTTKTSFNDSCEVEIIEYMRNKTGELTSIKSFDDSGNIIKESNNKFVYDSNENWIVKKEYKEGDTVRTIIRNIVYF